MQNRDFRTRFASLYGSQTSSIVFAFKTATLAPELQVSMGPSPHLWFLFAKQRLLDLVYKSLWLPDLTCRFCLKNRDFRTRMTSLYGSQTSPMAFCNQNRDFSTRIASLDGSQPSSVDLCIHNSVISTRITSLHGSQTSPVVLCM